ncbi:DUF86 domain-containing protein [Zhihengliuella halotolerans]|uniref:Uncharacterized protein with HEPN domain n=1 Tax=Zhihengliuella halotolerans TaxID=370736 RepID=A0A4Q8AEN6_9MICC|nr:HepT-like ribonuclease domain-containing protein [Zhihengliuella halotolerans]RZU62644.1 uncharacterized protein with HEPN domain [Zhihengliuella halotolerans]
MKRGRVAYDGDEALQLASEAIVHKLGEAVSRLPDSFIVAYPEVRWRSMKGMHNLVAHEYHAVDYSIIWQALEAEIPAEAERVRDVLRELDAE